MEHDSPDFSGEAVLDTVGKELGAIAKLLVFQATVPALKNLREMGEKEAKVRSELTNQQIERNQQAMKEWDQQLTREARDAKLKDPRNLELTQYMEKYGYRPPTGVSLDRNPAIMEAHTRQMGTVAVNEASTRLPDLPTATRGTSLFAETVRQQAAVLEARQLAELAQEMDPLARAFEVPEIGSR